MSCPCDRWVHPPELVIPPGLTTIPRRIAGFPEFRRAMLSAIPSYAKLYGWQGRDEHDLGIMLLEMWAYLCDSLAFYDETIAHECYLRTARLDPSVRKLIALLGYLPTPALAAMVDLALLADGRKPVPIPVGTAFRSGAFGQEPPQVFETGGEATVHPFLNQWSGRPTRTKVETTDTLLLTLGSVSAKVGDVVLVEVDGSPYSAGVVDSVQTVKGGDGEKYMRAQLSQGTAVSGGADPAGVRLLKAGQTARLWDKHSMAAVQGGAVLALDGLYRAIRQGQYVVLQTGTDYRYCKVVAADEDQATLYTCTYRAGHSISAQVRVTVLTVSGDMNGIDVAKVVIHFAFSEGGTVTSELATVVTPGSQVELVPAAELPPSADGSGPFLLQDRNDTGRKADGWLDLATSGLTFNSSEHWDAALLPPLAVYRNIVSATRGETVASEVLGSGDASVPNQTFKLLKKPLTHLSDPGVKGGIASTLQVWVNGVRWREARSFFGVAREDRVYVVRQDDEQESFVTFGDGLRGARLPSGKGNITASYRYGAGAAAPPAGSISQVARPCPGLRAVKNPVAASPGRDAETGSMMRVCGPRSALTLGRAVSLRDMEAIAASTACGVARASWGWNPDTNRTGVTVWYIPGAGAQSQEHVLAAILEVTDPSVAIAVRPASRISVSMMAEVEKDEDYLDSDVRDGIRAALLDPDIGLLVPASIGIGEPVFRSRIMQVVVSVPGVVSVSGLLWGQSQPPQEPVLGQFSDYYESPGTGNYFDLDSDRLTVNIKETSNA